MGGTDCKASSSVCCQQKCTAAFKLKGASGTGTECGTGFTVHATAYCKVPPVVVAMLVPAAKSPVPRASSCMGQPPRKPTPVPRTQHWQMVNAQVVLALLLTANCAVTRNALT